MNKILLLAKVLNDIGFEKDYLDLRCDDDLDYHDFNEAVIESSFFD
jgi:hypothetical protein